jgi:transposase
MICPEQVFLAVEPVDMRWGMERLSCHVQYHLGRPPSQGKAWCFTNRARTRLKLLVWDGTGVWLCQRRLHRGCFHWPRPGDSVCRLDGKVWQWLIRGVEWQRLQASTPDHWQV